MPEPQPRPSSDPPQAEKSEKSGSSDPPQGGGERHFADQVTNLPPTEIVCTCGRIFQGPFCLTEMTHHKQQEDAKWA